MGRFERSGHRLVATSTAFILLLSAAPARATDDLSGTWVSSHDDVEVYASAWGPGCGTLPEIAPLALPARLEVRDEGGALVIKGEGLEASTARCPAGMTEVSSRRDGGAWTIACEDGAIRHEIVWAAVEPTRLEMRHRATVTGLASCNAVAVQSASFSRESAPPLTRRAPDDPRCATASVASKVEVRPAAAAVRAGGAICFAAGAYDAEGCPAPPGTSFSLSGPKGVDVGAVDADGCFRAPLEIDAPTSVVVTARGEHATGVALVDLLPGTKRGASAGTVGGSAPGDPGPGAAGAPAETGIVFDETAATAEGSADDPDAAPHGGGRADISTIIGAALAVGVTGALAVLLGHFITLWSRRRQATPARSARARGTPAGRAQTPVIGRPGAQPRPAPAAPGATSWTPGAPGTPAPPGTTNPETAYVGGESRAVARTMGQPPQSPGAAMPSAATLVLLKAAESPEVMVCPACRRESEDGARYCTSDGSTLVSQAVASSTVQGGICPRCHRGTEAGTRHCPHDGEEVLPYALYQTTRGNETPSAGRKICPSCNAKYEGEETFCGRDGADLVLLN